MTNPKCKTTSFQSKWENGPAPNHGKNKNRQMSANRPKIIEIADIKTGYTLRTVPEISESGATAVIQMRDLLGDDTVDCSNLTKIDLSKARDRTRQNHARKGDIILRSRGLTPTTAIIREDPGTAIVASPLLVIRVKNRAQVLPDYLHWYLNQREAQTYLKRHAEGTLTSMISRANLIKLTVPLPTLAIQQNIADIAALATQERTLLTTLAKKRWQKISQQLTHHAKEAHP